MSLFILYSRIGNRHYVYINDDGSFVVAVGVADEESEIGWLETRKNRGNY